MFRVTSCLFLIGPTQKEKGTFFSFLFFAREQKVPHQARGEKNLSPPKTKQKKAPTLSSLCIVTSRKVCLQTSHTNGCHQWPTNIVIYSYHIIKLSNINLRNLHFDYDVILLFAIPIFLKYVYIF